MADQVYRFKVALKHRKSLWRCIEVRGRQTLYDLDQILREAFKYDTWDHLSEFFRGRAWRSEGMGEIQPDGGGDGARRRIDRLKLSEGDTLEYVYDFGENVENVIVLEKVSGLEEDAEYPRIVSQNKPRYRYCESCKKQGRKVLATWVCVDCSVEALREVLLCDDCLTKDHEDHYAEEKLY